MGIALAQGRNPRNPSTDGEKNFNGSLKEGYGPRADQGQWCRELAREALGHKREICCGSSAKGSAPSQPKNQSARRLTP